MSLVRSHWNILCDFDGTIALDDVIDALLERHGLPGWAQLEQQWREGKIGSRECMQGQVALLALSQQTLDAYLDTLQIDPQFPAFVALAREQGMTVQVVSDGLDYAIKRILARHGLADLPVAANHLEPAAQAGRWQLSSPFSSAECRSGTCKCALAERSRSALRPRTLLVGDGASDFCAAGNVDLVLAKHRLIDHCRLQGIAHAPIRGFADAIELLPRLDSLLDAAAACAAPAG